MIQDKYHLLFVFSVSIVFISYLYILNRNNKKKNKELISIFLEKIKTLPEPYVDLDLNFSTYLPIEEKLSFIYNLNKVMPSNSFKVYRCRINGDICFILAMGTSMGTHLLYSYTIGNEQFIDSFSNVEFGFTLNTKELVDMIKIR